MPGQADILKRRQAFRSALDGLGGIFPPGSEITGLRQVKGKNTVGFCSLVVILANDFAPLSEAL